MECAVFELGGAKLGAQADLRKLRGRLQDLQDNCACMDGAGVHEFFRLYWCVCHGFSGRYRGNAN
jgi:hypothetical protein